VKSWRVINDLSQALGRIMSPRELLPRVLDMIFEELPAERGVIFVVDEETGELLPEAVRYRDRRTGDVREAASIVASRTILDHVRTSREGVLCSNVHADER